MHAFDRLLPSTAASWGFEDLRRARTLLAGSAVALVAYGVIGVLEFRNGVREVGLAYAMAAALVCCVPLLLHVTASLVLASNVFLFVAVALIGLLTLASGGQTLGVLYSASVIPLAAVLLGGRRFSIAWTLALVTMLAGVMLATQRGVDFPLQPDPNVVAIAKFRGAIVLVLAVLALALVYESVKNRAFRDIAKAYARVEAERLGRAESEQALRASEERFRRLFQQALLCIHEIDLEGRLQSMNPAGLRILGLEREDQIRGLPYTDLVGPQDRARVADLLEQAYAGKVCEFEFKADVGKTSLSFASSLIPLRDAEGVVVKLIGHTHDVTEQRRAEEELRASEAKYQDLYENAPDMFASVEAATGKVVGCNRTLANALGCDRVQILDRPLYDFYHPDCHAAVQEAFRTFLESGEVQSEGLQLQRSDGSTIDVSLRMSAVRDEAGRVLYGRSILRDVSKQTRVQEALRVSEERLAMALDATSEGVWDWNLDTGETFFSPRWFESLGYEAGELPSLASSREALVHPDDMPRVQAALKAHFEQLTPFYECENRLLTKSGEWRQSLHRGRVVARDPQGKPLRMVGVDVDIRERKSAEEALQQARKLDSLGVLAGGIAHDFNNLLVGILGSAELALSDLAPDSAVYGRVQDLKEASQQAAELAHQLLVYTGKGKLRNETLDLGVLVEETVRLLRRSIPDEVRLDSEVRGEAPGIQADAAQIRQVVINLVTNAAESFGPAGGTVVLRTGVMQADRRDFERCYIREGLAEGRFSYLEVRDDGCGMDQATRERIFDPFFSTKRSGRGLGLASTLGVMRGHGGTLGVESRPGRGTSFRLLFPYARPERVAGWDRRKALTVAGGTILLVDDNPTVLAVTEAMLRRHGFDVMAVRSGEAAIEALRAAPQEIRAAMLDMTMPGMDGEATLEGLRLLRADLPVIFFSGHSEEDAASLTRKHAATRFLPKPFTSSLLSEKFAELLGGDDVGLA